MCDALDLLDRMLTLIADPQAERTPLERFLRSKGYSSQARTEIAAYIESHGSASGCESLDFCDWLAVEALVPAGAEGDCVEGCVRCHDAALFRQSLLVPTTKTL